MGFITMPGVDSSSGYLKGKGIFLDFKIKKFLVLWSLVSVIVGCHQKGKITRRLKNKTVAETLGNKADPSAMDPSQAQTETTNNAEATVVNIQEDSTSEIPFTVSGLSAPSASCNSNFLSYSSSNASLVAAQNAVIWGGVWPNCTAVFLSEVNANGSTIIEFTAHDGATSVIVKSFTFVSEPVNDSPAVSSISSPQTTSEDTALGVAFTAEDVDGALTCTAASLLYSSDTASIVATSGAVTWSGTWPNCSGSITPVANANGTANITFTISDGALTASRVFAFSVTAVNDAPLISDVISQSTNEDSALNDLAVTISDIDNTLVCATALSAVSSNTSLLPNANITVGGTAPGCNLSLNPASDQIGTSTVTLTVSDGVLIAADSFVVTVSPVNDTPAILSAGDTSKTTAQDTATTFTLATGSDPDTTTSGETLSYFVVTLPASGSLSTLPTNALIGGSVTYTPNAGYVGSDSFAYQICDSSSTPVCTATTTVSFTVFNVNEAPSNMSLSGASIAENNSLSAVVGSLSSVDPDAGDSFNYSLVSGTGSTDNSSFNISGSNLELLASANFETKDSYSIRLRTTDAGGLFFEKAFTIAVTNVNEAPSDLTLSSSSLTEGQGPSALVGSLGTSDPDSGDTYSYALVTGVGSADNGMFTIDTGNLRLMGIPDFETKPSYSIRLRTTDAGGLFFEKAVTVTVTDRNEWAQEAYIKSVNATAVDYFGTALASSGNLLAVGAPYEDSNQTTITNGATASASETASGSGAVYVYVRSGTTWTQQAYIKAANAEANDNVGVAVALSDDTLAVSASYEASNQTFITNGTTASSNNSSYYAGAVYVYRQTGSSWAQEAYIKAAYQGWQPRFGSSVSLLRDSLAVGVPRDDVVQSTITNATAVSGVGSYYANPGAVYVYRRTGSSWAQEAYIKPSNGGNELIDNNQDFGASVALSSDSLAVGAPGDNSPQTTITNGQLSSLDRNPLGYSPGAVFVYRRTMGSFALWQQEAYIKAANLGGGDQFGTNVSLSGDTLAVGTPYEDSHQSTISSAPPNTADTSEHDDVGAVYLYRRSGPIWAAEAFVKASNSATWARFGASLSLSGNTLTVGASGESSSQTTITNGQVALTGSGKSSSGAAYVYRRVGTNWAQEAYVKAANADAWDAFGGSISLNGDTLFVGATGEDSNQTSITSGTGTSSDNTRSTSGAVYVYRYTDRLFDAPEVAMSAATTTSITVGWSATPTGSGNGNYRVVYGTSPPASNCASGTVAYSGAGTSVTISGLTAGTDYYARVCSTDGSNFSEGTLIRVATNRPIDLVAPSIVSLTRGSVPNPVPLYTILVDYIITFTEPVVGLSAANFSISEVGTNKAATGQIRQIDCSAGATCTVWLETGNVGNLRLDLSSPSGVTDYDGNALTGTITGEIYTLRGWYQEAYIKAANAEANDIFSVPSISGGTLAVGASGEDSSQTTITNGTMPITNNSALGAGAVYIYARSGSSWSQQSYIKAANAEAGDSFSEVLLSGDSLAVTATGEDSSQTTITNGATASGTNSALGAGAVYLYTRSGSSWSQQAYIKAANAEAGDSFGFSVSLSGETLAVGAPYEDGNETFITNGQTASSNNSSLDTGSVYVYRRTGSAWAQEAYVKAVNADVGDKFAWSVSISGDTLAVGAIDEDSLDTVITNGSTASADNNGWGNGAAYVYRRIGSNWVQEAFIKAANTTSSTENFGKTVSLNGDTLAVSDPLEYGGQTTITNGSTAPIDADIGYGVGAVYVYRRTPDATGTTATWEQEAYIKTPDGNDDKYFGTSLVLSGETLVAGANQEWTPVQNWITNGRNTNALYDERYGAAWVFRRIGVNWVQEAFIKAANVQQGHGFGRSAALSGDTLAVGAGGDESNQTTITNGATASTNASALGSGAVFIYRNIARLFDPDVRTSAKTTTSVSFSWHSNLGTTDRVKIAPAALGTRSPAGCDDPSAVTLGAGVTSYTYTGLASATKYGFRFCSFDGTNVSGGATVWENTD